MGGYNGKQALKNNEVYSPSAVDSAKPWSQVESLPAGRYAFGITSIADWIYLLGGKGDVDNSPSSLVYITQTGQWSKYETPPVAINSDVSLAPVGQYIYAFGENPESGTSGYTLAYRAIFTVMIPLVP